MTGGLARWNGVSWGQAGGVFSGTADALEVHNGVLAIGGSFAGNLVSFDGTSYLNLGGVGTNGFVGALHSTGGRLYVGGGFTTAGGVAAAHVAYWDGSWHALANPPNQNVYALSDFNGEVQVGGTFTTVGGPSIASPAWARWSDSCAPWIAYQPSSQNVASGGTVSFSATPASGYGATVRWYKRSLALVDGPTGTGSIVSGSTTTTLTLTNVGLSDALSYEMIATNGCGSDTSVVASLTVDGATDAPAWSGSGATVFEGIGPNPSAGATRVWFSLAEPADVRIRVHDLNGRRVREIDAGWLPAGGHHAAWDARGEDGRAARPGLYFVSVESGGLSLGVKRVTILR